MIVITVKSQTDVHGLEIIVQISLMFLLVHTAMKQAGSVPTSTNGRIPQLDLFVIAS